MIWAGAATAFVFVALLAVAMVDCARAYTRMRREIALEDSHVDAKAILLRRIGERLQGLTGPFGSTLSRMERDLVLGGRPFAGIPAQPLLALALAAGLVSAGMAIFVGALKSGGAPGPLFTAAWIALALLAAPTVYLLYRIKEQAKRHAHDIQREFPYFLDLMLLVLQAGGRPPQALGIYIDNKPGTALARELRVLRAEMATYSFADALRRLEDRMTDERIRIVLRNIAQAEATGTQLGNYVRDQAEEIRFMRSEMAERAAERLKSNAKLPEFLMLISITLLFMAPAIVILKQSQAG